MLENLSALSSATTVFLAQNETGPLGADFGKASPVGLLIIVLLLIAVLALGWDLSRRAKRMAKRRRFAEENGLDPFDSEAVDETIAEAEQNKEL